MKKLWPVFAASFLLAAYLLWLGGPAKTSTIDDYVSDEVWYVSSAVNVARKVLGIHLLPRINSTIAVYTVFFDNTSCGKTLAIIEALEELPGAQLRKTDYEKINAFAILVPLNETGVAESLPSRINCITDVMPGVAPDSENINNYLNTEHPPLVKYVIAAVIAVAGWSPPAWRLASYAMGLLALASATLIAYMVADRLWRLGTPGSRVAALMVAALPPLVAAEDQALRSMSGVAMLDIYVAAFDAAALAALARGRLWLASLLAGLAGASKYTGLFILPVFLLAAGARRGTYAATASILVVAASWAPFVYHYGPAWVVEQVAFAATWHTTSRPPGPPSTNPLGLITGRDGFVLYYMDGKPYLVAVCNPGLCVSGIAASLAALIVALVHRCLGRGCWLHSAASATLFAWLGYVGVYAAGNHTLYSFYSVQLSALSTVSVAAAPLLVDEAPPAARRLVVCARGPEGLPYVRALSAAAGFSAAAAVSHGAPVEPMRPMELAPLYSLITWDKLSRLVLAASGLLVYMVAASRGRGGWRRWLAAGLAAYAGPAAPVAVILSAAHEGVAVGVLVGLSLPAATAVLLGGRVLVGFLLGYAAASAAVLLAGARPGGIWLPWSLSPLVLVLAARSPSRRLALALASLAEPSLTPLLALEGGAYALLAAIAGASAAAGLWWLALAAYAAAAVTALPELLPGYEEGNPEGGEAHGLED